MGQGSDSCGGWEVEYDPCDDGLDNGRWTMSSGGDIAVKDMTTGHIQNAIRVAKRARANATFTDQVEKWDNWINIFEDELYHRRQVAARKPAQLLQPVEKKAPAPIRGKKVDMICHCGAHYQARQADLNRKQGLSCSKRCAAIRREFGRLAAKRKP